MPGCCVSFCKNRTEKGFRLFRLPTGNKNKDRRAEWLKLIGKDTLSEQAAICEVHFDKDQYENKRKDGRKLLRPFAKPNLLEKQHTILRGELSTESITIVKEEQSIESMTIVKEEQSTESMTIVKEEQPTESISSEEIESYDNNQNPTISTNYTSSCINVNSDNNSDKEVTTYIEVNNIDGLQDITLLRKNYDKNIKKMEETLKIHKKYAEDIKKLKKTLTQTMRQCSILKRKLQQNKTIFANLKKIFNTDQQNFLACYKLRGGGTSWSAETINKALRLYVTCGQKGYKEIRRQNLPYPSIRTLQYWIQRLKCRSSFEII